MKSRLLTPTSLVILLLASDLAVLHAGEAAEVNKPAVVLQVKSLDELHGALQSAAKNFLPDSALKEVKRDFLDKLDLNMIKGVDPKKPLGLYATIGAGAIQGDLSKTFVVILLPVSDEMAFVDLLGKTGLLGEKKGEEYDIQLPNVPIPAQMRFVKGYAHICVATDKIPASALIDPGEVFSNKEKAGAVLRVRVDRVPEGLKKVFLAAFSQSMKKSMDDLEQARGPADGPPSPDFVRAETALRTMRLGERWITLLLKDSKELIFRVDLDPKTGVVGSEMSLEPLRGSDLAKSIREIPPAKNDFADIVGADSVVHVLVQAPLFIGDLTELLGKANLMFAESQRGGKGDAKEREAALQASDAVKRTLKEGKLDLAFSLRGPDTNGQYTAIGAFSLKDGALLEKALKTALKSAPKQDIEIKLDAFQVKGTNVHEIAIAKVLPPEVQKVVGTSSLYVALAPDACFVTFGPRGKELITQRLTQKLSPRPAPMAQMELSGKRLAALYKALGAGQEALEYIEKLSAERSTVMSIDVRGGEKLVLRVDLGLPALWMVTPKTKKATAPANN